ncbi:MAG: methyltransferase domain-containing protein, partial [Pseudomonadota bacterium]
PRLLKLPVVPNQFILILEAIGNDTRMLDVGANDRRLLRLVNEVHGRVYYKSIDIDTEFPHDYYAFEEVAERFNLIACLDVVEHLSVEEAFKIMGELYSLLEEGGTVFVSTPNVHHPSWYRRDCTHQTPFHYNELAGILLRSGFKDLEIFRVGELDLKGKIAYFFYKPLLKMLDMDYATSIIIKGKK